MPGGRLWTAHARDPRTPALAAARDAYDARWAEYTARLGSAAAASGEDHAVIAAWARTVAGPVLDAGCGPGHWSALLHSIGLDVKGLDASAAFIQHAARAYPMIPFRVGDVRTLDVAPESLGGVLAWFSRIHLDPDEMPDPVHRFTAALRPGGTLLVGFFSGTDLQPFDHAVVTAWAWPTTRMRRLLEYAGLEVIAADERPQATGRVFAEIIARRPTPTALGSSPAR